MEEYVGWLVVGRRQQPVVTGIAAATANDHEKAQCQPYGEQRRGEAVQVGQGVELHSSDFYCDKRTLFGKLNDQATIIITTTITITTTTTRTRMRADKQLNVVCCKCGRREQTETEKNW